MLIVCFITIQKHSSLLQKMKLAWIIIEIDQCVRQIISEDLLPQLLRWIPTSMKVELLAPDRIDYMRMLDNMAISRPKIS